MLFAQSLLYCLYQCFPTFSSSWALESLGEKIVENSDFWAQLIPTESDSQKGSEILFFEFSYVIEPELRTTAQNHAIIRY